MMSLNAYESAQVHEIALWKSERPSLLMETYRGVSRPFSRLIARIVPKDLAHKALMKVQSLAEQHEMAADLLKASGASRISELLGRSLEECDRLADQVKIRSEHLALLEGVAPAVGGVAIPGFGGVASAIVDVPFLLEATLRAVRRIGHCYGFPLDTEADHRFVMAILDLANEDGTVGSEEQRLGLWAAGGPPEQAADGNMAADMIKQAVVDDLPLESIPFLGDFSNLVLDYAFVCRADLTARRVFQERWLRTNGKVESIPASPEIHRRSSLESVAGVTSEFAYLSAYGISFGATFTTTIAGSLIAAVTPKSVRRGFHNGSTDATRDAQQFLVGFGQAIKPIAKQGPNGVPALA